MKIFVEKWLTLSVYEGDGNKLRHASSIVLALSGIFLACAISLPVFLMDRAVRMNVILVTASGLIASVMLYFCLRHGYFTFARKGTLAVLYIFVTLLCIANGTVHAPAGLLFILFITLAGLLFELRGGVFAAFISSLTVLGLILAENARLLPPPNHVLTLTNWFTYSVIFISLGAISYWSDYTMRQALRRAEEEVRDRKRAEIALRSSEARFRGLFEQKNDGVFIFGLDGQTRDANHRAAEMLGYTMDEISQGKERGFFAADSQSENTFKRLLAGEQIPLLERVLRTKDGALLPVEINLELIREPDGTPIHVQSVVRDISQRKQAEDAIKHANAELLLRMAEVEKLQAELREQAIRDPLTELYNRRYLNEMAGREIATADRKNEHLSVILADIDRFKSINDTYGHLTGDHFLREIAGLLQRSTRGSDIVCRFGGEEFLIVLPGTMIDSAVKRADEIRQKCVELSIPYEGKALTTTMSFGIAAYPVHGNAIGEIINKADEALYRAKQNGRNQVQVFS